MLLRDPAVVLDKLDLHSVLCCFPKMCCFHRGFQHGGGVTVGEMPVDRHQGVSGAGQPRRCLGWWPPAQTVSTGGRSMSSCVTLTCSVIQQKTFPFKTPGCGDGFTPDCQQQDAVFLAEQ